MKNNEISMCLGDLQMLAAGYLLIFIFVCFNLGRRNSVEHRVLLSIIGILYGQKSHLINLFFLIPQNLNVKIA